MDFFMHRKSFIIRGFPGVSDGKESAYNARNPGLIPGSGRSPRDGDGYPLQYSCLENPLDRGTWWSHSGTQLSDSDFHFSLSLGLVDISPLYRHSSIISELLGNFSLPTWESDSVGPGWGPGISGDFLKKSLQVILMSSWSGEALACFSWQVVSSLAVTLWRVAGGAGSGWYRALTRGWLTSPAHTASVLRLWEKKNYVACFIPHGIFY